MIEYDIRKITDEIDDWLQVVYPDRHPDKVWEKLMDELEELKACPTNAFEWADVLILTFDLMRMYGLDPAKAIHWKMDINKRRKWEMKDGKLVHVQV